MRQNFCSGNNNIADLKMCTSETTRYFHNTETMGAVHHALSHRPLSSGAHSNTIDLFPTVSLMSGTLFLNDIIRGVRKDYFLSTHIFKGRMKQIHDNQMAFSAAPRHPAPIPTQNPYPK
jgi:hypothetical protein